MRKWQIQVGFIERDEKDRTKRYEQMLDLLDAMKRCAGIEHHIFESGIGFDDGETGIFPPDHPKNRAQG